MSDAWEALGLSFSTGNVEVEKKKPRNVIGPQEHKEQFSCGSLSTSPLWLGHPEVQGQSDMSPGRVVPSAPVGVISRVRVSLTRHQVGGSPCSHQGHQEGQGQSYTSPGRVAPPAPISLFSMKICVGGFCPLILFSIS